MLLERDSQLTAFSDWLSQAAGGRGALVLVEGEAGCGKSTVLRAAVSSVESWWGYCDAMTTPRPLGPLLDIAESAGFDVPEDPFDAYDALLHALRARDELVVVVIEDVHWADDATLSMLQFLGRRLGGAHAVLALSYRSDEVGPGLRRVLGDLARHREAVRRLSVGPLSPESVRSLTEAAGLDPEEVHRVTGGNPFFVSEVVAAGGGIPASVQDAVLARFERLPPEVRETTELVSAEPGGLELTLAPDAHLSQGVLVVEGDRVRFRHELARLAVYDALAPSRRTAVHRRLLELLDGDADLARLAHHAMGTHDPALVVAHATPAAASALRRGAHRQAESFLRAVLATQLLDDEQRVDRRLDLGLVLAAMDRLEQAVDEISRALVEAERTGNVLLQGRALSQLAVVVWRAGDVPRSAEVRDRAVEVLRPLGGTKDLADALTRQARGHMLSRHYAPAMTSVREAAAIAESLGDEAGLAGTQVIEGATDLVMGHPKRGTRLLTEALATGRRLEDNALVVDALRMLGSGSGEAKLYDTAFSWEQELLETSQNRDNDYDVAYARAWQGRIRCEQGRWDEAVELAEQVSSTAQAPINRATALAVLGRVGVRRGAPRAIEQLTTVRELTGLELQHRWVALCSLAEAHWLAGSPAAGAELLEPVYEQALGTDSPWARGEIGFWLWRCGGLAAPSELAAEPFAAHMRGDFARAAELWAGIGCPYEQALALVEGEPPAALQGLEVLDRLGARPLATMTRQRLSELGVATPRPHRRSTLAHPLGLTAREAEIHDLLRDGLTNAEIAERLVLSTRTVDHHVSAVLRKAGVSSRGELQDR